MTKITALTTATALHGQSPRPRCSAWVDEFRNKVALFAFRIGSSYTEPACGVREMYRGMQAVDILEASSPLFVRMVHKIFYLFALIVCGVFATFLSLPAAALRYLGTKIQTHPYVYQKGNGEVKQLPQDRSFTLFSWNVCCIGGGYEMTDGGVHHWHKRVDGIMKKISEQNADVNCLYETFDFAAATSIAARLKKLGYAHCYYNIGAHAIGVSSGILVASKYEIKNLDFFVFPKAMLVGRTKVAEKGIVSFDLMSQGERFARIHATHLQHSEQPQFATTEEEEARRVQMQSMVQRAQALSGRCAQVFTGDFNCGRQEFESSPLRQHFEEGEVVGPDLTWGGDQWCVNLLNRQCLFPPNKKVSGPMKLDYSGILPGSARSIRTTVVSVGFDAAQYRAEALSDHSGLLSRIMV